ncbi:hypothetical protein BN1723_005419 [Verticillium longisporum]|uniref:Uncharacterized protein n=1 Tax=Verticillium longisporum TaxID=100787 RepID=A0A0G4N8U5_VERLO|nr:hypothetical protein BN1723_005419 [Verticillium longisporum]
MLFGARPRPRDFVDPFPEVVFLSVPGRVAFWMSRAP